MFHISSEKMLSIPTVGALNLIKHRKTKSETLEGNDEIGNMVG